MLRRLSPAIEEAYPEGWQPCLKMFSLPRRVLTSTLLGQPEAPWEKL